MNLSSDYLTLKLRRLKGAEEMELNGRGLWFLILKGGAGACHCGPLPHRLGAGDILVVDSASQSRIRVQSNGEMAFWFFVAECEHLFPLFSGHEICFLQNVAERFKTGRVYPGSSSLAKQCLRLAEEVPAQFNLDHRSHVLRIVSAILSADFKAMQPKLADFVPMRDHVLEVFEQLQRNDILSLSVEELAKKFTCSRRHLNRLFHQHFGVSVEALRMEMRLLKAVSLLVDPNAKVNYVAQKSGFNHLGLFNTYFKKRFGASPSQWRKNFTQTCDFPLGTGTTGCPFQVQGLCLQGEKTGVSRMGTGQARPLEGMSLCGLPKDIVAVKNGVRPRAFERKEADGSGFVAEPSCDRRARIGG